MLPTTEAFETLGTLERLHHEQYAEREGDRFDICSDLMCSFPCPPLSDVEPATPHLPRALRRYSWGRLDRFAFQARYNVSMELERGGLRPVGKDEKGSVLLMT